ncbi:MAG: hypothetical protein Kow00128_21170 [Deltaproteobacteria bacterium]
MDHPFRGLWAPILLAAPFLIGFGIGLAFAETPFVAIALLWILCAFSLLLRLPPLATASCVLALCGALTAGRMPFLNPRDVEPFLGHPVILSGVVDSVRATETGWNAVAHDAVLATADGPERIRVPRIFLTVRSPESAVRFPAEVRAIGKIHPIRSLGNPGEVPREWFALSRRVQYRFSTDASKTVFLPRDPEGIGGPFLAARERVGSWLAASAGDSSGALFLRAVTTGETPPPSHPLVTLLRRTGLSHLLAISGLHAGIFFAASALVLRTAIWGFRRRHGYPDLNRIGLFGALPACWGYILMAGAPVSGVRAAGMITVAVLCWRFLGIRSAGAAWAALFLGTILFSPWQVVSPSFQLSYTAAFFLIACAERKPSGPGTESVPARAARAVRGGLIASAVAFAGTLPISGAFFGGIPAGAILWNLLFAGPLGTAGVGGALLSAAAGLFGIDGVAPIAGGLADVLDAMLGLLGRLSGGGAGYLPLPPSGIVAPLLAVAGGAWGTVALARHGRGAWPAPVAAAAAFLAWIHLPHAALPDPELRMTALNVGRGASHAVSFPGGGSMLVDCGSRLRGDAGARLVVPFLRGLGFRTVDILVLTHPHEDHTGGADAVLSAMRVGEIWIPEGSPPEAFGEAVARQAAKIRAVRAGEVRRFGEAEVRVRASGAGRGDRRTNERSLVLEIRYGRLSVWLPGDVEEGPGAWGSISPPGAETRVLFLPHHGSPGARPAAWLWAAAPAAAVTQNSDCAGWDNLLPSCRFFALENGAVTVRSDGGSVSIEQRGGARWWSRFLRLSKLPGGAPCPGDPARYPEWRSSES